MTYVIKDRKSGRYYSLVAWNEAQFTALDRATVCDSKAEAETELHYALRNIELGDRALEIVPLSPA